MGRALSLSPTCVLLYRYCLFALPTAAVAKGFAAGLTEPFPPSRRNVGNPEPGRSAHGETRARPEPKAGIVVCIQKSGPGWTRTSDQTVMSGRL